MEIEVVDVATNTNLGQVIAGSGPVTVQLGEEIGISAYVNWGQFPWLERTGCSRGTMRRLGATTQRPRTTSPPRLGVPGVGSQEGDNLVSNCGSVAFEFAAGGSQDVTLVVDGVSLTAGSTSRATEDVTVTATPAERPGFLSVPGTQLSAGRDVGDGTAQLWMDSLVWNANTPSGWEYSFAQTASVQIGFTLPKGNLHVNGTTRTVGTYANCSLEHGLDIAFPYGVGQPVFTRGARPRSLTVPASSSSAAGACRELFISAQTYYMARPVNAAGRRSATGSRWRRLTWWYYVLAEWIPHTDLPTVNVCGGVHIWGRLGGRGLAIRGQYVVGPAEHADDLPNVQLFRRRPRFRSRAPYIA